MWNLRPASRGTIFGTGTETWGRDAALWLGRRLGRLTLAQLAQRVGGVDYTTAGTALSRFTRRIAKDRELKKIIAQLKHQLSNVEM